MNKRLITNRFRKALPFYHEEAIAQRQIARTLFRLLLRYHPVQHGTYLEFGCGTGLFSELSLPALTPEKAVLNDICPDLLPILEQRIDYPFDFLAGDAETTDFPSIEYDVIASASTIQWFSHPESFLKRLSTVLHPKGILAISSFTPENLKEIRQITGSGLVYPDIRKLVSSHFNILEHQEERITLQFPTPIAVLQHLKRTGVTGNSQRIWTTQDLIDFETRYQKTFTCENGVSLTYTPIYIIANQKSDR